MIRFHRLLSIFIVSVLAACGSGGDDGPGQDDDRAIKSVVSFGDSLSDVGTFAPNAAAVLAQGATARFSTNGLNQTVWVENIAASVGASISPFQSVLSPTGLPPTVSVLGGNGYAQGGATAVDYAPAVPIPLTTTEQVSAYLQRNGSFRADQLVLFWIGGNDVATALQTNNPALIQGAVAAAVSQVQRIAASGARYIIVNNLPDIGKTPRIAALGPTAVGGARQLTAAFNQGLAQGLASLNNPNIVLVDIFATFDAVIANPASRGLINVTQTACSDTPYPAAAGPLAGQVPSQNALVCAVPGSSTVFPGGTLRAANAQSTYLFSDTFHPTTAGHRLVSDTVISTARGRGLPL